ncbi:MAG: hypothetical protein M3Y64_00880, partial [Gemmatimonadota bacterium]|nr:hypothetical protein [Gemmatimonadota bacterium]
MLKFAGRVVIVCALGANVAHAHPIHTTLTKITSDDRSVTLNIRAFADDFSATVAKFAGRPAPRDSSAPASDVLRYLQKFVAVSDGTGKPLALESCGIRRANELYWLCVRVMTGSNAKGIHVQNQMLTELHPDQVNIVQIDGPAVH